MARLIPNSIAVFGDGRSAAAVGLRKVLTQHDKAGSTLIIDYVGRGAVVLDQDRRLSLEGQRVHWYDTADRRRPAALFQFNQSSHFRDIFLKTLQTIRQISGLQIKDTTLIWAIEAAYELSGNGTVGLGALLKSLSASDTRKWFLNTQPNADDLDVLVGMLSWALHFPAVFAISEGNNRAELHHDLAERAVTWIECRVEHFESCEHALVVALVEAAVQNAISYLCSTGRNQKPAQLSVVYLFPSSDGVAKPPVLNLPFADGLRCLAVHRLQSNRSLPPLALAWAMQANTVWLVGGAGEVKASAHQQWLSEKEIEAVRLLKNNQMWVKSNETGASAVVGINQPEISEAGSFLYRRLSTHQRKLMPMRQMVNAVNLMVNSSTGAKDMWRRLWQKETLRLGWLKTKSSGNSSYGTDGVTLAMFKATIENQLTQLSLDLKQKKYRCKSLRRVFIPKPDGDKRPIGISCIRDKVVQAACLILMEPLFEPDFSPFSFAFRHGRSAHQAIDMAKSMIADGRKWIVIADIQKCFDSIDHEVLLELVERKIADQDMISLLKHWLKVELFDFHDLFPLTAGVPQGLSLSPLLANIYLDPLDKVLEGQNIQFVRYADDIILVEENRDKAAKALGILERTLLNPLHLELKPAKTQFVSLEDGFSFLGFAFGPQGIAVTQNRIDRMEQILHPLVKGLGHQDSTLAQRVEAITRINACIRGFRNYFLLSDEKRTHHQLAQMDERLSQLSAVFLPADMRNDPVWICRERFFTGQIEASGGPADDRTVMVSGGLAYPEAPKNFLPFEWLVKDNPSLLNDQNVVPIARSTVLPKHKKETERPSPADSLIHKDGRLYILSNGTYVTLHGDDIVLKKDKKEFFRCDATSICLVFIQGYGITTSVNLQLRLSELNVPIVIASPSGLPLAVLNSVVSENASLRVWQVLKRNDPHILTTGLKMIGAKVGNQAAVLRYFAKYRHKIDPQLCNNLNYAADEIRRIAATINDLDPATASVRQTAMGFEGQAGAIYWNQIVHLLHPDLGFSGRKTRSAADPVNQCLNYVYALLYGEVWHAVTRAGLDPYFGLIHGSQRDEGSLVFDLIEEFRAPFVDRLVFALLGRGFQPVTDSHNGLKTIKRKLLVQAFRKGWSKHISWRAQRLTPAMLLDHQAQSMKNVFLQKGGYHPYRMRW